MRLFRLLLLIFISTGSLGCMTTRASQNQVSPKPRYELTFAFKSWDFGPVKKGQVRSQKIPYRNTGMDTVTIEFLSACECTSFVYPEDPIAPGEKGELEITFDSAQKEVNETISITILLKEKDPETGYQIVYELKYTYELQE